MGYSFRLSDKVNWSVQANLINAFKGARRFAVVNRCDGART